MSTENTPRTALHGTSTMEGATTYFVVHDGIATVYGAAAVLTMGIQQAGELTWETHPTISAPADAHAVANRWREASAA